MYEPHLNHNPEEQGPQEHAGSDFPPTSGPALATVTDAPIQADISPFESKQHYRAVKFLDPGHPVEGLRVASDNRIVCFSHEQVTVFDRQSDTIWGAAELPLADGRRHITCVEPLADGRIAVAMQGNGVSTIAAWEQRPDGWWISKPIAPHGSEQLIPLQSGALLSQSWGLRIYRREDDSRWSNSQLHWAEGTGALRNLRVSSSGMLAGSGVTEGMFGTKRSVVVQDGLSEDARPITLFPGLFARHGYNSDLAILSSNRIVTGTGEGAVELWENSGGSWDRQTVGASRRDSSYLRAYIQQIETVDESSFWFSCGASIATYAQETKPGSWSLTHAREHTGPFRRGMVLPDGRFVVPTMNHTLDIFGVRDGEAKLLESPYSHRGYVNAVGLLGAGRLVSGSADGTLVIWDGAPMR
ncbi:MAG: WD40 repeat domain-containing protein [Deltaproteobacteria bacterium]|nr:WD40 repeat domain-containing protein [Deltaproteobacteria bacterium]